MRVAQGGPAYSLQADYSPVGSALTPLAKISRVESSPLVSQGEGPQLRGRRGDGELGA